MDKNLTVFITGLQELGTTLASAYVRTVTKVTYGEENSNYKWKAGIQ